MVDARAELETLVIARMELRRVEALIRELTPDQRLVLISQVALGWRLLDHIPTWAHWSVRHPPGL